MSPTSDNLHRIHGRLQRLYPDVADATHDRLRRLLERYGSLRDENDGLWSERDAVLITYGDQIRTNGEAPLQTLKAFLTAHDLQQRLSETLC